MLCLLLIVVHELLGNALGCTASLLGTILRLLLNRNIVLFGERAEFLYGSIGDLRRLHGSILGIRCPLLPESNRLTHPLLCRKGRVLLLDFCHLLLNKEVVGTGGTLLLGSSVLALTTPLSLCYVRTQSRLQMADDGEGRQILLELFLKLVKLLGNLTLHLNVFIKVDLELLKSRETRLHHEVVNRPHDVGADLGGRRSHFCESLQVLLNVELISTMKSYRGDIRFVNFFSIIRRCLANFSQDGAGAMYREAFRELVYR